MPNASMPGRLRFKAGRLSWNAHSWTRSKHRNVRYRTHWAQVFTKSLKGSQISMITAIAVTTRLIWNMDQFRMNSVQHGWLLLQMKCPSLRSIPEARSVIRELCEEYSLLIRHIDLLRRNNTHVSLLAEYEELARFLEADVARQLGIADKRQPNSSLSRFLILSRLVAVAEWIRKLRRVSNEPATSSEIRPTQRRVDG